MNSVHGFAPCPPNFKVFFSKWDSRCEHQECKKITKRKQKAFLAQVFGGRELSHVLLGGWRQDKRQVTFCSIVTTKDKLGRQRQSGISFRFICSIWSVIAFSISTFLRQKSYCCPGLIRSAWRRITQKHIFIKHEIPWDTIRCTTTWWDIRIK